jgi:hypothetical protein
VTSSSGIPAHHGHLFGGFSPLSSLPTAPPLRPHLSPAVEVAPPLSRYTAAPMTSSIVVGQKSHKNPNPNSTLDATDANPPPGTTAAPHRAPPPLALFGELHDSTTQTTPQLDDTDLDTAVRGHVSRYARRSTCHPIDSPFFYHATAIDMHVIGLEMDIWKLVWPKLIPLIQSNRS